MVVTCSDPGIAYGMVSVHGTIPTAVPGLHLCPWRYMKCEYRSPAEFSNMPRRRVLRCNLFGAHFSSLQLCMTKILSSVTPWILNICIGVQGSKRFKTHLIFFGVQSFALNS